MPEVRPAAVTPRPRLAPDQSEPERSLDESVPDEIHAVLTAFLDGRRDLAFDADEGFARTVVDRLRSFILDGGKRIRPLFAWWGWRAAGGARGGPQAETMLRAAGALELVQACALVHDDVMDRSPLRRGAPALHAAHARSHRDNAWEGDSERYGDALAILTGDLALVWADDMLDDAGLSPAQRAAARPAWQAMRTEMMAGQFLDVHGQARRDPSEFAALRIARLKTAAYSVERPLHFGAAIAGAAPEVVAALRGYGGDVGTAFQLRDDLLGVFGDPATTGKPAGEDLSEGKRTLLLAIGLRRAQERGDTDALEALTSVTGTREPERIERARAALDRLGAREAVEERIDHLTARGISRLAEAVVEDSARAALGEIAGRIARRGN
ncbi:polyprenyl synthetase family protein [Marinactinospora thermotolerans]|uniref:Geranylgeranyl diphosphate synthase, type I n=1 Tax=Marinactinospora thermotolerans DSM 45154 TaxID=1122192 RepID=A0A1T4K4A2_9ACTN|nr:polyprenyl synthetase family protein [Marinactinospora thermotolerans]SJZ37242.1 geranylgeranyl diphosphate synthase, type I [Marinactinospora thermotolerans DSM 45154]